MVDVTGQRMYQPSLEAEGTLPDKEQGPGNSLMWHFGVFNDRTPIYLASSLFPSPCTLSSNHHEQQHLQPSGQAKIPFVSGVGTLPSKQTTPTSFLYTSSLSGMFICKQVQISLNVTFCPLKLDEVSEHLVLLSWHSACCSCIELLAHPLDCQHLDTY